MESLEFDELKLDSMKKDVKRFYYSLSNMVSKISLEINRCEKNPECIFNNNDEYYEKYKISNEMWEKFLEEIFEIKIYLWKKRNFSGVDGIYMDIEIEFNNFPKIENITNEYPEEGEKLQKIFIKYFPKVIASNNISKLVSKDTTTELFKEAIYHLSCSRNLFSELHRLGLCSGNDNHIGDIGEFYVYKYFMKNNGSPKFSPKRNSLYDIENDGRKISVKTMTNWSKTGKSSKINLMDKNWDDLFVVKLNDDLLPLKIASIHYDELILFPPIAKKLSNSNNGQIKRIQFKWWDILDNKVVFNLDIYGIAYLLW
jgi:hypothetical protein